MAELPGLLTAFELYDVLKDIKDAEKLMQEDTKRKERIVNEITVVEATADKFLNELKQQKPEDSFESSLATKDYVTMMSQLNGMLEELKEKKEEVDKVWALHQARVDHMMRMCHFNRSAEKVCWGEGKREKDGGREAVTEMEERKEGKGDGRYVMGERGVRGMEGGMEGGREGKKKS